MSELTSKDIIRALRIRHKDGAMVTEITMRDPFEMANYNRWYQDTHPYFRRKAYRHAAIADSLPENYVPHAHPISRRIDALILDKQKFTAAEIKVSRADFKRDTEEKRRAWKSVTSRFVYVTPTGLLTPEEIPEGCGLWEVSDTLRITVKKKAKINKDPDPIPYQTWITLFWRFAALEKEDEQNDRLQTPS